MSDPRPAQKPYFLRACHEWMSDSGLTPQLIVDVAAPGLEVPPGFDRDGRVVLNVSVRATEGLVLGNEAVEFRARFGDAVRQVRVPIASVLGIFARETGEGLAFAAGDAPPPKAPEAGDGGSNRPHLKVVR